MQTENDGTKQQEHPASSSNDLLGGVENLRPLRGDEIRFGPKAIWGIWNELGQCWIKAESGRDYKTENKHVAAEIMGMLKAQGATGLEVKKH
jgi:hypothetical protein